MDQGNPNEWVGTWVTTSTADDGSGYVQAVDIVSDADHPLQHVAQMGLPYHYSRGNAGFKGYLLRQENGGGIIVSTWTDPPSDCVDGEGGIYVAEGAAFVRVRRDGLVELRSSNGTLDTNIRIYSDGTVRIANPTLVEFGPAAVAVGRDGDPVDAAAAMAVWIAKVQAVCVAFDPTLVPPTDFGVLAATTTLVKAG